MTKNSFEKAKDYIIKAGFSHIKIEMEADLGREDGEYECDECYGEGTVECCECEGSGVVNASRPNGSTVEVECDNCSGEGRVECDYCDGSGERSNEEAWEVDTCNEWIKNHVSDKAREALTYSRFYYDGSVDSEMTLTIPVANAEYLIEYLEAFKALSEEIGNGLETGGAGLHLSVIPTKSNGYYPAPAGSLPVNKWNNFSREVTKLLPALYMLASADEISRPLDYRRPQISDNEKYSAIFAYRRSAIEYRLFETCYNNPEMVMEYIEVIAKTLKFYVDPSLRVKELGKVVHISNGENKTSRFYQTPDSIMVLRNQLKYIKPDGRSISELMKSRKVPNITELKKLQSAKTSELRKKWYADKKRIETVKKQPLTERQLRSVNEYVNDPYYNMSREEAETRVRGIQELPSLIDYLNNNLTTNYNRRFGNSYQIIV